MSNSESPAKVWYEANCHCGAIKYRVNVPSLETQKVTNCNCSICCKNGYLNVYPKRTDVVFHKGEDHMKGYLFGEKRCMHKFCPTCGSSLFVDPHMDDPELIVVNVCVGFVMVLLWNPLIWPRYGCSKILTWISWSCGSTMGSIDYSLDMTYDWLAITRGYFSTVPRELRWQLVVGCLSTQSLNRNVSKATDRFCS